MKTTGAEKVLDWMNKFYSQSGTPNFGEIVAQLEMAIEEEKQMSNQKVVILMTDDDKGYWSIYEESGQALEHDFESEQEAITFAEDSGWELVENFNIK